MTYSMFQPYNDYYSKRESDDHEKFQSLTLKVIALFHVSLFYLLYSSVFTVI